MIDNEIGQTWVIISERDLANLQAENADLRAKLDLCERGNALWRNHLDAARAELDDLRQQLTEAETTIADLDNGLEQAAWQLGERGREIADLRRQLVEAQQWQPVESGEKLYDGDGDEVFMDVQIVDGIEYVSIYHQSYAGESAGMRLPDDVRLRRLVKEKS